MPKSIHTLVEDIYDVIRGHGGWDATCSKFLADEIVTMADARFLEPPKERSSIGMSSVGKPCKRQLWYRVNMPGHGTELDPETHGTFFYGDLLEALILALAKASGHRVEGLQDELEINGIKGHRDAVIDGMTVDVKSASSYSFQKFEFGQLRKDDPFGYISQLSSYVYAGKDDPLVTDKERGAFLVVKKDRFKLCLDIHNFKEEIKHKEEEIDEVKKLMDQSKPPKRGFSDIEDGYWKGKGKSRVWVPNGNLTLPAACGYCEYKKVCWPGLRAFAYSNGPKYYTKVINEPRVEEIDL